VELEISKENIALSSSDDPRSVQAFPPTIPPEEYKSKLGNIFRENLGILQIHIVISKKSSSPLSPVSNKTLASAN
jgi:hypothetical protein